MDELRDSSKPYPAEKRNFSGGRRLVRENESELIHRGLPTAPTEIQVVSAIGGAREHEIVDVNFPAALAEAARICGSIVTRTFGK